MQIKDLFKSQTVESGFKSFKQRSGRCSSKNTTILTRAGQYIYHLYLSLCYYLSTIIYQTPRTLPLSWRIHAPSLNQTRMERYLLNQRLWILKKLFKFTESSSTKPTHFRCGQDSTVGGRSGAVRALSFIVA